MALVVGSIDLILSLSINFTKEIVYHIYCIALYVFSCNILDLTNHFIFKLIGPIDVNLLICSEMHLIKECRARFEITVTSSIWSQITVLPSTFFMKWRIFVSVMWFNHRIPCKIYLNYRFIVKKLSNTEYRNIVRPPNKE